MKRRERGKKGEGRSELKDIIQQKDGGSEGVTIRSSSSSSSIIIIVIIIIIIIVRSRLT